MRHERAVLVVLSYVIGFTASFIAFGISYDALNSVSHEAAVAKTAVNVLPVKNTSQPIRLTYNDGLYLQIGDEERLISAPTTYGQGTGFHAYVTDYVVSNDGKFVTFCAYETETAENCINYRYNIAEESLSAQ